MVTSAAFNSDRGVNGIAFNDCAAVVSQWAVQHR